MVLSFDNEHGNRLVPLFENGKIHVSEKGTDAVLKTLGCLIWVFLFILFLLSLVHSYPKAYLGHKK